MGTSETARKPAGELRRGWTTGASAAAAAAAAYRALLTGSPPESVTLRLPRGETPTLPIVNPTPLEGGYQATVIKDAGDDPDVTHGAEIIVSIHRTAAGTGISFHAGEGVGTVTLPGLPVPVGEPAINPGPRGMIKDALNTVAEDLGAPLDVAVTISVPTGEDLAAKTMNPRLGIKGGISILGTTGVVVPFSCSSWIHSIHRGVDVAIGQGIGHIVAATGSTSEAAAMRDFPDLAEQAYIDMGDFAGGLLKYLRRHPVPRLTLVGGVAKLAKLAQGNLDLHSKSSTLDMKKLAETARRSGADDATARKIETANTAMEALQISTDAGLPLANRIAIGARETAMAALAGDTDVDVRVYDRAGVCVGTSDA